MIYTSRLSYLSKGQSVVTTIRTPSSLKVPSKMQLVVALTTGVSTLGNMGCRVFKGVIQNQKNFWPKTNIPKGSYYILRVKLFLRSKVLRHQFYLPKVHSMDYRSKVTIEYSTGVFYVLPDQFGPVLIP